MNTVKMRNVEFGAGVPKICVPIVGKTKEDILEQAKVILDTPADIIEWRMDWFEKVEDTNAVKDMAKELREVFNQTPILATFRSKKEGGEKEVPVEYYVTLNKEVAKSKYVDAVDVELFTGDKEVEEIVKTAHENGVKVVMSNHDFFKTPSSEEIVNRLCLMQEKGADIPKIAVMPTCKKDVLTLLSATREMAEEKADRPIITMSMAATGVISRLSGEVFGSCLTFGAAKQASAPGQMGVNDLKVVLETLHKSL